MSRGVLEFPALGDYNPTEFPPRPGVLQISPTKMVFTASDTGSYGTILFRCENILLGALKNDGTSEKIQNI